MNIKNSFNLRVISISTTLLVAVVCQSANAKNNELALSESEMPNIVNGKIAKVQAARRYTPPQKPVYRRPAVQANPVAARRSVQAVRRPAPRYQQQPQYRPPQQPRYVAPVRRQAPPASLPAWRRPASHTETRGSGDAIFAAAKNKNMALLQQILASGVDVDHRNFNGETALHIAASLGNLPMVQYLISQGANVNGRTGKQWLPIHHAMRFGHPLVANYLISRKASVWAKTSDGLSAIDFAKASKNPHIQGIARKYGR